MFKWFEIVLIFFCFWVSKMFGFNIIGDDGFVLIVVIGWELRIV